MGESYSILNISYVIGLQIRTGNGPVRQRCPKSSVFATVAGVIPPGQGAVKEGNVFLSSHDERRFFDCYDSLIERAHITVDEHKFVNVLVMLGVCVCVCVHVLLSLCALGRCCRVLVVTDSEDIMAQARWRFGDRRVGHPPCVVALLLPVPQHSMGVCRFLPQAGAGVGCPCRAFVRVTVKNTPRLPEVVCGFVHAVHGGHGFPHELVAVWACCAGDWPWG
jgi:hypothetical protein